MKLKNILLIFMLNYLVMLFVCCIIEFFFISDNARQIQLLVTTAADMALEQVQATDDFFTTDANVRYMLSEGVSAPNPNHAYMTRVLDKNGSNFITTNLFEAYTGKTDFDAIYSSIYRAADIQNYINGANGNMHGDVSTIGFLVADYNINYRNNTNVNNVLNTTTQTWYLVPSLAQLGTGISGVGLQYKVRNITGGTASSGTVTKIWKMYDLTDAKKRHMSSTGQSFYYYTPLSLGVTYINADMLQALFMNNLDLLMRSKYYREDGSHNLNSEDYGNGVLKTAVYPNLVDERTLKNQNPINNGSFTLLRGAKVSGTSSEVSFYNGTNLPTKPSPTIEYIVVDMYDTTGKSDELLKAVLGAKVGNNGSFKATTGQNLKDMDSQQIQYIKDITGSAKYADHKPFVVAKVTFTAEFILPYMTPLVREMRGRIGSAGDITGRNLFNPFEFSSTDGSLALGGNYVDITTATSANPSVLGSNSTPFSYTTFFAVTP